MQRVEGGPQVKQGSCQQGTPQEADRKVAAFGDSQRLLINSHVAYLSGRKPPPGRFNEISYIGL